ncbi:putative ribonuclease H-like domain-containing protein [Tanacetum coccineum]
MALGYQNPFYLKQAQRKHQCLYDGKVLLEKHDPPVVHDSEETLQLAQESRQKMKQLNKEIKPANYTKINHLSGVFVSQTAKSQEEVYLVNTSKMATVSKSISIPNEEFLDDTTLSVARKFLNELLIQFRLEVLGTVSLWNDHVLQFLGFGDLQWGNIFVHQRLPSEGTLVLSRSLEGVDLLKENRYWVDPKNDREDIKKLGTTGDISFFIGYSANSCAYRVYNRRTKKIMETINVTFDELSSMAFEQSSLKPRLQSMTSGQISSGLDLDYAPSTITTQRRTKGELDLLFEAMYGDFIGDQLPAALRTGLAAQAPQALQTPTETTTIADTPYPASIADNVPNAMFDDNTFVNPFATLSTSADHPLEQVIGEPSRPVLTRNQLKSDGDICMYALTVSTMEPKNVSEAMTDPAWIESMQEDLIQFKRLNVWMLVPLPDHVKPLTLKWLFKNKHDEENMVIRNKTRLVVRGYRQKE